AHWSQDEELQFVHFLWDHFSEAGQGGNFKATTYNAASVFMEQRRTTGGPKTADACKNKYTSLRKIYYIVDDIKRQSGWTWSDDHGAGIDANSQGMWDAYVQKNPDARKFRNKGWPLWEYMNRMMPTKICDVNV
ncbi:hypothetical protein C8J56DRAFT_749684, partial [Mycena floridula]